MTGFVKISEWHRGLQRGGNRGVRGGESHRKKRVSKFDERSHHVIENKRSRLRTKPNEANFPVEKPLLPRGDDLRFTALPYRHRSSPFTVRNQRHLGANSAEQVNASQARFSVPFERHARQLGYEG